MSRKKNVLVLARAAVFVALGVLAALFFLRPPEIQTDIIGLLGTPKTTRAAALVELSRASGKRVQVLVESENFDAAKIAAKKFLEEIKSLPVEIDAGEFSQNETNEVIEFYARERFNFLSKEDRTALAAGRFDDVSERAAALWFAPVTSPVPRKIDPFGTLTRFLAELPAGNGNFSLRDGFLATEFDGKTFVLIALKLPETATLADAATTLDALAAIRIPAAKIHLSGTPLHTVSSARASVRDINVLTALGAAFVILLLVALFRSLRALALATASITAGLLGGFFATAAVFQNVHTFTLLFGTTLIGLAVDYTFHAYLRRDGSVVRPLCAAFATSALAFGILIFSSFSILKQTAVFSISGLAFVLATTLLSREKILGNAPFPPVVARAENLTRTAANGLRKFLRKGGIVLFVPFVAFGLSRISFSDDIRALYNPSAELLQKDLLFMQVSGRKPTTRFLVSTGKSLEEILQNEENSTLAGSGAISAFLPSEKRQRENFELQKNFYANETLTKKLGIAGAFPSPEKFSALDASSLPTSLRKIFNALFYDAPQGKFSATALDESVATDAVAAETGTFVVSPVEEISEMLNAAKRQTYVLLAGAFAVLFAVLFAIFRRGVFRLWAAPFCSAITVAATLGLLGIPLSFFHLLAFFLIVGLAVDYGIFRRKGRRSELAVWLSCATSALSFGLLAFTDFSLLKSFGLTLALGFAFSFLFSLFFAEESDEKKSARDDGSEWFLQKENHAGAWRLEILWFVYKTFPLCIFRALLAAVSFSIFAVSPKIRCASKNFRKILNAAKRANGSAESRFSAFAHVNAFADAIFDRFDATADNRQNLKIEFATKTPIDEIARGGATLLCSHVGNIEIFQNVFRDRPDLPRRVMNAFQEVSQNSIFFKFYKKHCASDLVKIWDVEKIDLATATALSDALARGEFVMMSADRVSAGAPEKTIAATLLGHEIALPKGAFSFARMLDAPIYFVACVKTAPRVYTFFAERAPEKNIAAAYAKFLEKLTRAFPTQFFNFFDFFKTPAARHDAPSQR